MRYRILARSSSLIGIVLIVAGVVALFRSSLLLGVVLIVIGVLLGGLNVF